MLCSLVPIFSFSTVLFLLEFFYVVQCFSVHTGVKICMYSTLFIFSSFPSSGIIVFLVALTS